jgi:uncharacterized surface protein with fasciclin (FAS1) repeats
MRCGAVSFFAESGEHEMRKAALSLGLMAALISASACNKNDGTNQTGQTPAATKAAGGKTIASGLGTDSKFMAAAKEAGIDKTLTGPGPYTVFVPDDAAFAKLPAGALDNPTDPTQRAKATSIVTYHMVSGTVLAADIGKAIDNAKDHKAPIITVGGPIFTATKDGGAIVLTDSAGNKAHITKADDQYSNGVVHHIDIVMTPPEPKGAPSGK